MVAAYEVDIASIAPFSDIQARLGDLEARLARGLAIIDDRAHAGLPVDRYEDHWLQLLKEYEDLYDATR